MILGIDEVGRGPWAGPLVVGAVVLGDASIDGLTDSKKLTKKRREALSKEVIAKASGYGLGWVSAEEIDNIGLSAALKLATIRAVSEVKTSYNEIIIDGTVNFLADTKKGSYVSLMKKADLLIPSVSAASIIAKVARDNFMTARSALYPEYGFDKHSGYGTAKHRSAIDQYGVTPLHRLSYAPLAQYRPASSGGVGEVEAGVKPSGALAEDAVASYLTNIGHSVLARNWRTRSCEVDIVSQLGDTIYFTEVKYRKNASHGDGFDAIDAKKYRKMVFAAEYFIAKHNLYDKDVRLSVASLAGDDFKISNWFILE